MFADHYSELFSSGAQQTTERRNYLFRELAKVGLKPSNLGNDRSSRQRLVELTFKTLIRSPILLKLYSLQQVILSLTYPLGWSSRFICNIRY